MNYPELWKTYPPTALIDGDIIINKAGFASQKKCYKFVCPKSVTDLGQMTKKMAIEHVKAHYSGQKGKLVGYFRKAKDAAIPCGNAKRLIEGILRELRTPYYKLFISNQKPTFRHALAKTLPYKGNRSPTKRCLWEQVIREYLIEHWNAITAPEGLEVDDVLGIAQDGNNTVIVTIDKDLDMVPGWHLDLDVGTERKYGNITCALKQYKTERLYKTTEFGFLTLVETLPRRSKRRTLTGAGRLWFCAQLLLGDSIDNITHFKGTGPLSVYKILKDCQTYKEGIQKCFQYFLDKMKKQGYNDNEIRERFLEQANLLWIKRCRSKVEHAFPLEWLEA